MTIRKASKVLLSLLLLVLLALALGVYWLLGTAGGARWLAVQLNKAELGLELQYESGSLLDNPVFTRLRWRDDDIDITLESLRLQWRHACLVQSRFCIRRISAESLTVQVLQQAQSTGNDQPIRLPAIKLPYPLLLQALSIEYIYYLDADVSHELTQLKLQAAMEDNKVEVAQLSGRYMDLDIGVAGNIRLTGDYPLALTLSAKNTQGSEQPIDLEFGLHGDLQHLLFKGSALSPWPLKFQGSVFAPLADLRFRAVVDSSKTIEIALAEQTLGLQTLRLQAEGKLDEIDLELAVDSLALMQVDRQLLSASLNAEAKWQEEQLMISALELLTPAGKVSGELTLGFAQSFSWQAEVLVEQLNISELIDDKEWSSDLSGRIHSTGMLGDAGSDSGFKLGPEMWAVQLLDWQGSLWGFPARMEGAITKQAGLLQADKLYLEIAHNKVTVDGAFTAEKPLLVDVALPALDQFLPGFEGDLSGRVSLSGELAAPTLTGYFNGENLAYDSLALREILVSFDIQQLAEKNSTLVLKAQDAQIDQTSLGLFTLNAAGSQQQHHFKTAMQVAEMGAVKLDCNGMLQQGLDWQGKCRQLELAPDFLQLPVWTLKNSLNVAWQNAVQQLDLQPFCLLSGEVELCSDKKISVSQAGIFGVDVGADAFPMDWFAPLLSDNMLLQGSGKWRLRVDWPAFDELAGQLNFVADNTAGEWWLDTTRRYVFTLEQLSGLVNLGADKLSIQVNSMSKRLGMLKADLEISLLRDKRLLEGSIEIDRFDIAPLTVFDESLRELAGAVSGKVELAGSLSNPSLLGDMRLNDGKLSSHLFENSFDNIQLGIRFDRSNAWFDGSLDIKGSELAVDGSLAWQEQDWEGKLGLKGEGIPFSYDPLKEAKLSPDLQIRVKPFYFGIRGAVLVDDALITLKKLPQNAYSESADALLIESGEVQEGSQQWTIAADVRMNLGKSVHFRGFGADVSLSGGLRYLQKEYGYPMGEGEISIAKGYYSIWGQRLDIREGSFVFAGPIDSPNIKIEAVREIPAENLLVGLRGHGPIEEPVFEVFSEPGMDSQAAMHYLLTGRAPETAAQRGGDVFSAAALSVGVAGAEGRAGDIADKFGIENFQMSTSSGQEGAEVQLSGYISDDLFIRYGMGLFDRANTLTVRYKLRPQLFVEAASGLESALDIIYSFQRD